MLDERLTEERRRPLGTKECLENIDALKDEAKQLDKKPAGLGVTTRLAEISNELEAWQQELGHATHIQNELLRQSALRCERELQSTGYRT